MRPYHVAGIRLTGFALAAGMALAAAADIPPLPPLKPYSLAVPLVREGRPQAVIVAPQTETFQALAARLNARLKELTGAALPLRAPQTLSDSDYASLNMVLLGNFADNPAVVPLYLQHYVMADDVWPGDGGYELRTVHAPWGGDRGYLYLGGSNAAGVGLAMDAFLAGLAPGPTLEVPVTLRVYVEGQPPVMDKPEGVGPRVDALRGAPFRTVAAALSEAGLRYHATGDPTAAEVFRQGIPVLADIVQGMDRVTDARGSVLLPLIWDLVEESPVFSTQDRVEITRFFWEYAHKCPNAGQTFEPGPIPEGNNWNARANWAAARYFKHYYGVDVGGLYGWCEAYFGGQARFWKCREDCPGYGSITYHDLTSYALARPDFTWLGRGHLRSAADYALTVINNLGFASGFGDTGSLEDVGHWPQLLRVAAWYYQDGRYRYLLDRMPDQGLLADEYAYTYLRQNRVAPVAPVDMLGIRVQPLERWVYDEAPLALASGTTADKLLDRQPQPPYEKCFDKISFRDSFAADEPYLLLDGISHGYHAHPDGNALICYTDNGRTLLFDNGYFVPDMSEHNTLVVFRDGLFAPVPRFATLEHRVDLAATRMGGGVPGSLALCQTQLAGYNGVDWRRNIIWDRQRYFLCLDEVEARVAGDYSLQLILRTLGDVSLHADRVLATQPGARFALLNANGARLRLTGTNPPAANRHAIVEAVPAALNAGQRTCFINVFYSPEGRDDFPIQVVQAGPASALVYDGEDVTYAGLHGRDEGFPAVDAAVFAVSSTGFTLAAGTSVVSEATWFTSSEPVNIAADLVAGQATVETARRTRVSLLMARSDVIALDGEKVRLRWEDGLGTVEVPAGVHQLGFQPALPASDEPRLAAHWQQRLAAHRARVAALAQPSGQVRGLRTIGTYDLAEQVRQTIYVPVGATPDRQEPVPDLARAGKPTCWTVGSAGSNPERAMDGDPATYSAVSSTAPNANDLPKDIGVAWDTPQTISQVRISHYSQPYTPAFDGQDLQRWDGERWVSLDDTIQGADTSDWVHTFSPVQTTRLRLLVTRFSQMRTAIRSFEVFPIPVEPRGVTVRVPHPVTEMRALPANRSDRRYAAVASGQRLLLLGGPRRLVWEAGLPAPALALDVCDLAADGQPEIVVSAGTGLYCYDFAGNLVWEAQCPQDAYAPEVEPQQGPLRVIKCDDLDGDGESEIIAGAGNWFVYVFDSEGRPKWGKLNWAHQPTSIATVSLPGEAQKAILVGTTYNDANLFSGDGRALGSVSVGYHAAAMAVAAGDMDGDGPPELVAGSRIGGVHCQTFGTDNVWDLDLGAEVTATVMHDLDGDGALELLVASRNYHVLALDAAGRTLWRANLGNAVLCLTVADLQGDGAPEIIAGGADGSVWVLNAGGELVAGAEVGADVTRLLVEDFTGDGLAEIGVATSDSRLVGLVLEP
mgnify:CR=1 FL=1